MRSGLLRRIIGMLVLPRLLGEFRFLVNMEDKLTFEQIQRCLLFDL